MMKSQPMETYFFEPKTELKNIIDYIQIFKFNERNKEATFRVFPEGGHKLLYNYGNNYQEEAFGFEIKRNNLYFLGQFDQYMHFKLNGKTNLIIIKFTPYGGYMFLNQDMDIYLNKIISMKKLFKLEVTHLINKLIEDPDEINKVEYLQNFIYEKCQMTYPDYDKIKEIIDLINNNNGRISIPELADKSAMSISSLEKKFNKYIGFNPKTYCRIKTMTTFFIMHLANPDKNLYELALECGYHDQSHFIKDFKKFTGTSPRKYLKNIDIMGFKSIRDE